MIPHSYIKTEQDFALYLDSLAKNSISSVALDLEGEQGRFQYAYAISILQIFDGTNAVIVDLVAMGNNETIRAFLTNPALTKVMFSCANDIFMTQNILGCSISPIRDISVGQKLLGMPINILDHLAIDKNEKDILQRENWLKRPIIPKLLDYAINDVLKLMEVCQSIETELKTKSLFDSYLNENKTLSAKNFRINQLTHYKVKFPGFLKLTRTEKQLAGVIWVFRELIGKQFDRPVGYVLSKQSLASLLRDPDNLSETLHYELNRGRQAQNRIGIDLVESFLKKAWQIILAE